MEILKRKVKRTITQEEFKKLKEEKPFEQMRQDAKAVNFGCFPGDTEVLTDEGNISLSSLVPKINKGKFTPFVKSLGIITPLGDISPLKYTFYGETREWIEFELENGDTLKMTPNHQCIILRKRKRIVVEAKDILPTDYFLEVQTST